MEQQISPKFELKPHHVSINVQDIDATIEWYGDVLGFTVERRNFVPNYQGQSALIKHGDFYLELFQNDTVMTRNDDEEIGPTGTEVVGFKHLAFAVDDREGFTEMLNSKGVEITMERPEGVAMFIRDNSGNVLEFPPKFPPTDPA